MKGCFYQPPHFLKNSFWRPLSRETLIFGKGNGAPEFPAEQFSMLRGWWVDCLPWVPFWLKCPGKHPPLVLFWHSWVASRMAWPLELAPFSSLRACRAFYGVEDLVWDAFIRAAGDPGGDYTGCWQLCLQPPSRPRPRRQRWFQGNTSL